MDTRSRKRGIKASRERLELAMLNAGVKTQAELSDKIAEHEGLACPPKDTVNRAFRQQFVSPATIARIAHILQVPPEKLYLPEDEQAGQDALPVQTNDHQSSPPSGAGKSQRGDSLSG